MISIILVLIGIVIYLKLNKFYQFTVLSLSALLPFSFGKFLSVPSLSFVEWLTIVTFLMLINELVPLHSIEKRIKIIKFKGIEIFIFAILILITWTIISFVNYEMLYQPVINTLSKTGTKRLYFNIINNIVLFFTIIIFAVVYYEKLDFKKFFKILVYFSVSIGILRIFSYFFSFSIPLLYGTFRYDPNAMTSYGGIAYRFGGLAEVVTFGVPALFAYYVFEKKMKFISLMILLLCVLLSGGRTTMAGVFFSIILFSILFLPKNFIYLVVTCGIFFILFSLFAPQKVLEGQFNRLTTFKLGNFMGQDAWRGLAWKYYLDNFQKNPVFGKGIVTYQGYIYSSEEGEKEGAKDFTSAMLFSGGHGSYFSLLSTFGLGGITYFLIMIIAGIFLSIRKINQHINSDSNKTAIAVFCFMLIIIKSVDYITGGDGLVDATILFYATGLVASLTVLQHRKDLS
ncbi:MAG: O-antigen ligase family protein [Sphingobacteriaceae bacterium]|nr:O-antigen ligase family protein [Sphingobacteriaceae bacterium]